MDPHIAIYDVFAQRPFDGNQAAVVRLGRHRFSNAQLLALAGELGFPETAVSSSSGSTLTLRFATAARLVNRCGHATLAAIADYAFSRHSERSSQLWSGHYRVGTAMAEWRASMMTSMKGERLRAANGMEVAVAWPDRPRQVASLPAAVVYAALGLDPSHAATGLPACVYNSGNRNALVSVRSLSLLERANPRWDQLRAIFKRYKLVDLHLYCLSQRGHLTDRIRLRSRNLFPYGVLEETATGTASVALAAFLVDRLPELHSNTCAIEFAFEQGVGKRRGRIQVVWCPKSDGNVAIWLAGRVFPIVEGRLIAAPKNKTRAKRPQ